MNSGCSRGTSLSLDLRQGQCQGLEFDARNRLRLAAPGGSGAFVSAVTDLGAAGLTRIDWLAQWTAPQRWTKHAGNPIFGPRQTGGWDNWCNGVAVLRNPDGKSYKMFHAGLDGAGIGFAEASLADPLTWVENPASPILKPRADNWEGNRINQPRVVKVTETHWRMFYTGWGFGGAGHWAMGCADSLDAGLTWKRIAEEPVLPPGQPGEPDDGGAFVPEVLRLGDRWLMWYSALKLNGSRQNIHLCLATSHDGLAWVKHPANPVLTDDFSQGPDRNVISRCCVRYEHGVFQMWYSHAKPDYRIRYAESLDGVSWEPSPVLYALDISPAPAWDDQMVEYPTVDVVDGQWRLWFCGNGYGSVGFAAGLVEAKVTVAVRSGPTPGVDAQWTAWQPVSRDMALPSSRYLQVQVRLTSPATQVSPTLNRLTVAPAWGLPSADAIGRPAFPGFPALVP
jgi:predicted GH43/DUF377 family glycosyl hydrolase